MASTNATYYRSGVQQSGGYVGTLGYDGGPVVGRFAFTTPNTGAALFSFSSAYLNPTGSTTWGSGNPDAFRWQVTTSPTSYPGKIGTDGNTTSVDWGDTNHLTSGGTKTVQFLPNTTYYLWVYPSVSGYNRWAIGSITVTLSGVYGTPTTVTCTNPSTFGSASTITMSRSQDIALHTVTVTCLGQTETLLERGTTYPTLTWTPSIATYAPLLTNATSTTATIAVETFYNGYSVGVRTTTVTVQFNTADIKPSVAMAVSDPTGYATTYGAFVASKSKIRVELTPTYQYGATGASVSIIANDSTYTTNPAVTDEIASVNFNSVSGTVVDSRGVASSPASQTITILAYTAPAINSFALHRCEQDGTLNDQGAYMRIDYDVSVTALNNHNSKSLSVKYKKRSDANYTTQAVTLTSYTQTGSVVIAADTNSTYDVQLVLADDFATVSIELQLSTAFATVNFKAGGDGIAIGKVSEYSKMLELAAGWTLGVDGVDQLARIDDHDTDIGNLQSDVQTLQTTVAGLTCEIGANPDGHYAKFANGLLICWKNVTHENVAITNTWGSMYESPLLSFGDWPVAFYGLRPFVSVDVTSSDSLSNNTACMPERIQGVSLTSAGSSYFIRPVSTTGNITVDIIGVGLWK